MSSSTSGRRGRHRRRRPTSRAAEAAVPLAVGGTVAAVALLGPLTGATLRDGLGRPGSSADAGSADHRDGSGGSSRTTLLSFPESDQPSTQASPVPTAAPGPTGGSGSDPGSGGSGSAGSGSAGSAPTGGSVAGGSETAGSGQVSTSGGSTGGSSGGATAQPTAQPTSDPSTSSQPADQPTSEPTDDPADDPTGLPTLPLPPLPSVTVSLPGL